MKRKRLTETVKQEKRYKGKFFILLFGAMIIANVIVAIGSAAKGSKLLSYESKAALINRENRELREHLIEATSLKSAEDKVVGIGLIKPENIIYLGSESTFAKLP